MCCAGTHLVDSRASLETETETETETDKCADRNTDAYMDKYIDSDALALIFVPNLA